MSFKKQKRLMDSPFFFFDKWIERIISKIIHQWKNCFSKTNRHRSIILKIKKKKEKRRFETFFSNNTAAMLHKTIDHLVYNPYSISSSL